MIVVKNAAVRTYEFYSNRVAIEQPNSKRRVYRPRKCWRSKLVRLICDLCNMGVAENLFEFSRLSKWAVVDSVFHRNNARRVFGKGES